jgi:anti-sigma factor RsiW
MNESFIAYRSALDALEEATKRYLAIGADLDSIIDEPIGATVEERKAQYQRWAIEKTKRLPAYIAAFDERNRCIDARDAAFAALKGN